MLIIHIHFIADKTFIIKVKQITEQQTKNNEAKEKKAKSRNNVSVIYFLDLHACIKFEHEKSTIEQTKNLRTFL